MITALLLRWRQPLFFLSFLLGFEDLEGVFQLKRFHDSVVLLGIAADERISRFLSPLEHHHQQTACTGWQFGHFQTTGGLSHSETSAKANPDSCNIYH